MTFIESNIYAYFIIINFDNFNMIDLVDQKFLGGP